MARREGTQGIATGLKHMEGASRWLGLIATLEPIWKEQGPVPGPA